MDSAFENVIGGYSSVMVLRCASLKNMRMHKDALKKRCGVMKGKNFTLNFLNDTVNRFNALKER